jgi:hypothetical protein
MLHEEREIPEIYYMKHRHDDDTEWTDYEKTMLDKMLSPYIYENDMMSAFAKKLQPLTAKLFDQMNIMKNYYIYLIYNRKHHKFNNGRR